MDFARGDAAVVEVLERAEAIYLPLIVLGELCAGFAVGRPIPTNDRWIAAGVLQHDLVLYARDDHFDHLPQIPRL